MIGVSLERKGRTGIKGSITLPEGLEGTLKWNDEQILLVPGTNTLQ